MHAKLSPSVSQWRCRLCGFERYHQVSVLKKNGVRYDTSFFACSRCSVMFLNVNQFNAVGEANPNIEMPPVVTPLRGRRAGGTRRPQPAGGGVAGRGSR